MGFCNTSSLDNPSPPPLTPVTALPEARQHLHDIVALTPDSPPAIFLDYDGTLTPIVPRPEDAVLSTHMRRTLAALADTFPVAIITGRDLRDIRTRVGLDTLFYGGSHGFEIAGPQGFYAVHHPAEQFLSLLDQAEVALQQRLQSIAGCQVERKRFAIAVHYRRTAADQVEQVNADVAAVQQAYPDLRRTAGKKVYELRPRLDWHKGTALFWVLQVMAESSGARAMPIYIGDDLTDEDAFAALHGKGVGIMVADGSTRDTAASYRLQDPEEVDAFLQSLRAAYGGHAS